MKLIAYYRVSTKEQGTSGLGLEAQRAAVQGYARQHGATIVAEYTEVESGRRDDRPQLAKAVANAKRSGATLTIAKLDRLARRVSFVSALMDSGCEFVACDNPHANRLTIHILAAVAESEAKAISDRTKAALAAYKARGGRLGVNNLTADGARRGAQAAGLKAAAKAKAAYADLVGDMLAWRALGATLQAVADRLNEQGQTTQRGLPWTATAVYRVLGRVAA